MIHQVKQDGTLDGYAPKAGPDGIISDIQHGAPGIDRLAMQAPNRRAQRFGSLTQAELAQYRQPRFLQDQARPDRSWRIELVIDGDVMAGLGKQGCRGQSPNAGTGNGYLSQ